MYAPLPPPSPDGLTIRTAQQQEVLTQPPILLDTKHTFQHQYQCSWNSITHRHPQNVTSIIKPAKNSKTRSGRASIHGSTSESQRTHRSVDPREVNDELGSGDTTQRPICVMGSEATTFASIVLPPIQRYIPRIEKAHGARP